MLADREYESLQYQRIGGFRTMLGVPIMRDDVVIGVISLWKERVDPFTVTQIGLLTTFSREYRRAMSEQITTEFEELYRPLNVRFEVHAYPSPEGLSVYFRDVTERRRAEESRARLATIIDSTPDFVGSFDDDGWLQSIEIVAVRIARFDGHLDRYVRVVGLSELVDGGLATGLSRDRRPRA